MKKGAILCASGIGDGLLMMIGAHHLRLRGYEPVLFHNAAEELSLLFEGQTFLPHPPLKNLKSTLHDYERVIVENDHSERAWHLFNLREKGLLTHLTFLFPTPSKQIRGGDFLFDSKLPVASNIARGCQKILQTPYTKDNELTIPQGKTFRKHSTRVVIHPMSNDPKRNWKKRQFLTLADKLKRKGFFPTFCMSPAEKQEWEGIEGVDLPTFANLREVKEFIYESGFFIGNDSGLGHLASNLGIPTLTISGNPKRVRLWRPDWSLGKIATLPFPLPNFKGVHFPFRDNFWQNFVSVRQVYQRFMELAHECCCHLL